MSKDKNRPLLPPELTQLLLFLADITQMRLHAPGGFSLTSMHGIQSDIDVVLARQELLQGSEIKDVPQQVGIGFHRVHNFHWTQPEGRNKTLLLIL